MRWKNCVPLPTGGRRTQFFHLIFTQPIGSNIFGPSTYAVHEMQFTDSDLVLINKGGKRFWQTCIRFWNVTAYHPIISWFLPKATVMTPCWLAVFIVHWRALFVPYQSNAVSDRDWTTNFREGTRDEPTSYLSAVENENTGAVRGEGGSIHIQAQTVY